MTEHCERRRVMICGVNESRASAAAKEQSRRLVCRETLKSKGKGYQSWLPGHGSAQQRAGLATYSVAHGVLGEANVFSYSNFAMLGFQFGVTGELIPPPVPKESFQDGPAGWGDVVAGTVFYAASQRGGQLSVEEAFNTIAASAMYVAATTNARILTAVRELKLANCLAEKLHLAHAPYSFERDVFLFEWDINDIGMLEKIGDDLVNANFRVHPRLAGEVRGMLRRRLGREIGLMPTYGVLPT